MKRAWRLLPEERPDFSSLASALDDTLSRREYLTDPLYHHLGRTTIGSLQGSIGRASTGSKMSLASAASRSVYMVGANERYLAAVPETLTVNPHHVDVTLTAE
jgi:hypothetical protein